MVSLELEEILSLLPEPILAPETRTLSLARTVTASDSNSTMEKSVGTCVPDQFCGSVLEGYVPDRQPGTTAAGTYGRVVGGVYMLRTILCCCLCLSTRTPVRPRMGWLRLGLFPPTGYITQTSVVDELFISIGVNREKYPSLISPSPEKEKEAPLYTAITSREGGSD